MTISVGTRVLVLSSCLFIDQVEVLPGIRKHTHIIIDDLVVPAARGAAKADFALGSQALHLVRRNSTTCYTSWARNHTTTNPATTLTATTVRTTYG